MQTRHRNRKKSKTKHETDDEEEEEIENEQQTKRDNDSPTNKPVTRSQTRSSKKKKQYNGGEEEYSNYDSEQEDDEMEDGSGDDEPQQTSAADQEKHENEGASTLLELARLSEILAEKQVDAGNIEANLDERRSRDEDREQDEEEDAIHVLDDEDDDVQDGDYDSEGEKRRRTRRESGKRKRTPANSTNNSAVGVHIGRRKSSNNAGSITSPRASKRLRVSQEQVDTVPVPAIAQQQQTPLGISPTKKIRNKRSAVRDNSRKSDNQRTPSVVLNSSGDTSAPHSSYHPSMTRLPLRLDNGDTPSVGSFSREQLDNQFLQKKTLDTLIENCSNLDGAFLKSVESFKQTRNGEFPIAVRLSSLHPTQQVLTSIFGEAGIQQQASSRDHILRVLPKQYKRCASHVSIAYFIYHCKSQAATAPDPTQESRLVKERTNKKIAPMGHSNNSSVIAHGSGHQTGRMMNGINISQLPPPTMKTPPRDPPPPNVLYQPPLGRTIPLPSTHATMASSPQILPRFAPRGSQLQPLPPQHIHPHISPSSHNPPSIHGTGKIPFPPRGGNSYAPVPVHQGATGGHLPPSHPMNQPHGMMPLMNSYPPSYQMNHPAMIPMPPNSRMVALPPAQQMPARIPPQPHSSQRQPPSNMAPIAMFKDYSSQPPGSTLPSSLPPVQRVPPHHHHHHHLQQQPHHRAVHPITTPPLGTTKPVAKSVMPGVASRPPSVHNSAPSSPRNSASVPSVTTSKLVK